MPNKVMYSMGGTRVSVVDVLLLKNLAIQCDVGIKIYKLMKFYYSK